MSLIKLSNSERHEIVKGDNLGNFRKNESKHYQRVMVYNESFQEPDPQDFNEDIKNDL